jgi:predicted RNA-binding Zn-ribbon protein involved in translation (DUF1610 family)
MPHAGQCLTQPWVVQGATDTGAGPTAARWFEERLVETFGKPFRGEATPIRACPRCRQMRRTGYDKPFECDACGFTEADLSAGTEAS